MRIRPASVAAAFALSSLAVTGLAAPAVAQTPVCDPYSTTCTTPPPPTSAGPRTVDKEDCASRTSTTENGDGTATTSERTELEPGEACATSTNTALPFTGGELVLLTGVGAGALAGGVALIAVGRRRKPDVA